MAHFIPKFAGKSTNIEPYWELIKRIIHESDIVLEILDARLVELSRNEEVERLIEEENRPVIYVVNKSDLVSKESIKKQIKKLREKSEVVFISTKKRGSIKILLYTIKKVFKKYGKREAYSDEKLKFREARANIVVGVLGYPNVGKSSIINRLSYSKKVKVSKKAGTTHGIHWISATKDIKLIDSPGVIPLGKEDEIRYGLIGAKDNERLRHPDVVGDAIIKLFMKNNYRAFEKFYEIIISDDELKEDDSYSVALKLAGKKRFLLKGNELDENKTYQMIIRDWQEGRLRL
jgi:ribosome biogenesis GTPase A